MELSRLLKITSSNSEHYLLPIVVDLVSTKPLVPLCSYNAKSIRYVIFFSLTIIYEEIQTYNFPQGNEVVLPRYLCSVDHNTFS